MKQLTVIFTILTALLLTTSCSKEELPGDENTDEPLGRNAGRNAQTLLHANFWEQC